MGLEGRDFRPIGYLDGYPPIEDHALIGDGSTAALVSRNGTIPWLCIPRFDSPPLFSGILDHRIGGGFEMSLAGVRESRQAYIEDTGVVLTDLRSGSCLARLTDALTVRSGADLSEDSPVARGELVRSLEVLDGDGKVAIAVDPRGGCDFERRGEGLRIRWMHDPDMDLEIFPGSLLEGARTEIQVGTGDRIDVVLKWGAGSRRRQAVSADELVRGTVAAWRRWIASCHYDGPRAASVRRSAITLKLLDHIENGAMVAAPTSSLPERIGGPRNWDYRYAWVRDVAFSVYALRRIGFGGEAWTFLEWALDAAEQDGDPKVLYDLDGRPPPEELLDEDLEGYRGSHPVRWGNAASDQRQNDIYGEILDCAYQWSRGGGGIDPRLWRTLRRLAEDARRNWREPDHGIWEVRTPGRRFTYSAAACQIALDRATRLAEHHGLEGDVAGWRAEAGAIRDAILEEAWSPASSSLTEHLGGGGLDASLLALPLRRVLDPNHPKMVATTEAISRRLGAEGGLLYRYLSEESPDGIPGGEGAFLLCSFWLVDNLAYQGRLDEAQELYESLCDRGGPLGLLPEQIDPDSGAFLGNYPQAFSHVGLIASGVNLARLSQDRA